VFVNSTFLISPEIYWVPESCYRYQHPWSNLLATGTGHWARVVIEYYVVRTGAGRGYEYESNLSTVVLVMVSSQPVRGRYEYRVKTAVFGTLKRYSIFSLTLYIE
jgi:hypothetical protein